MDEKAEDLGATIRADIPDFRGYDEIALDQYLAVGHYVALRREKMPQAQAATLVCEIHGHDAPRGLCRRCGLGVDLTDEGKKRERERDVRRQEFLARRGS